MPPFEIQHKATLFLSLAIVGSHNSAPAQDLPKSRSISQSKSTPASSGSARQRATASIKDNKVWHLSQWNAMSADWQVYVGKSGLRALNKTSHTTVLSRAPKWDVVVFNEQTKKYWMDAKEKFFLNDMSQGFLFASGLPSVQRVPLKPSGKHEIQNGLSCEELVTDAAFTASQKALAKNKEISEQNAERANMWATSQITAPKESCFVMSRMYGVPYVGMVPIKMNYWKMSQNDKCVLRTFAAKQEAPPEHWLDLPESGTRVTDLQQARLDSTSEDGVGIMLENIDQLKKK